MLIKCKSKTGELATRQSIQKGVQDRVRFKLYDGYKIPYKPNTFDAIIFFESICYVPHKQFLFQQLYKILKPNCYISGQDWNSAEKTTLIHIINIYYQLK